MRFKPTVADNLEITTQDTMSALVNASEQWKFLTQNLSSSDRCNLGRDILTKKPSEAALIWDIDLNDLGFHFGEYPSRIKESEEESEDSENPSASSPVIAKKVQEDKISKWLYFAINNPDLVTIF